MTVQLLINILAFMFGSIIGSFLNVVIYRLPRDLSVITPRSSCPNCKHSIKWYENIPMLSYFLLRGKCAGCSVKIPVRYPLVELTSGLFALLLAPNSFGVIDLTSFIFYFSIASIFLAHLLIDLEHQLLPDKINIYFLAITIPFVLVNYTIYHWLVGGLIGFLGPYGITVLFYKIKGEMGLGGGDIKLFGILGLLLGPLGILNNIFMSCMLGSIVGLLLIALKKMDRQSPFAFGPFILIIATMQIFFPWLVEYINPLFIK